MQTVAVRSEMRTPAPMDTPSEIVQLIRAFVPTFGHKLAAEYTDAPPDATRTFTQSWELALGFDLSVRCKCRDFMGELCTEAYEAEKTLEENVKTAEELLEQDGRFQDLIEDRTKRQGSNIAGASFTFREELSERVIFERVLKKFRIHLRLLYSENLSLSDLFNMEDYGTRKADWEEKVQAAQKLFQITAPFVESMCSAATRDSGKVHSEEQVENFVLSSYELLIERCKQGYYDNGSEKGFAKGERGTWMKLLFSEQ